MCKKATFWMSSRGDRSRRSHGRASSHRRDSRDAKRRRDFEPMSAHKRRRMSRTASGFDVGHDSRSDRGSHGGHGSSRDTNSSRNFDSAAMKARLARLEAWKAKQGIEGGSAKVDDTDTKPAATPEIDPLAAFMAQLEGGASQVTSEKNDAKTAKPSSQLESGSVVGSASTSGHIGTADGGVGDINTDATDRKAPATMSISLEDILSGNFGGIEDGSDPPPPLASSVGGRMDVDETKNNAGSKDPVAQGAASGGDGDDDEFYAAFKKAFAVGSAGASSKSNIELDNDDNVTAMAAYNEANQKSALDLLREKMKKKELKPVDHDAVEYMPFRKNFYTEHPLVAATSKKEVSEMLSRMEIRIRGKEVPRPVWDWDHMALSKKIRVVMGRHGYEKPFPIQAQAIPVIMSGRDCIGVAKTGSGKTAAFSLPMFRHIMDQPRLADGEGCV